MQVHEFWDYYEDLFRPVPEDLVRALTREPDLDTDPGGPAAAAAAASLVVAALLQN